MKKLSLLFFCFISLSVLGQSYEGTIQYDKKKQTAFIIEYVYPPEAVQNAFVQKMENAGFKAKEEKGILNKDKGFLVFKNAYVTDISEERMDYIIKVERKSRKESDEAVFYLVMVKGDGNAIDKMRPKEIDRAKSFLNNMLPDIEAANLELQIKVQEEVVAKAEKKLKGLRDDQVSLEAKLQQNKTDQETTQKDIEAQKQALGVLIGKRKIN
ncbi:MAG: hypothetical protein IPP02_07505 [Chitinophagaceae bacterium]|mgnify:CR=1 FL=1|jgi:hypothetical protein|nr:hypothetical protein [Chitinophagaceae bacterium]MBK7680882.1 hypothetical protein [Chitinophagaceae bacterium]MBK8300872.1 hypothetical protein [Chitinophagaceae bacterium]MBK9465296.1 hypothetical protein [Chitinophagaceae bacterium]MBK9660440.1 hypothetical protein [Chitinophagaceae bacterium]